MRTRLPYCLFRGAGCYRRGGVWESLEPNTRVRQPVHALLSSFLALGCGPIVDWRWEREPCRGPAQETGVALQRQCGDWVRLQRQQRDSPLSDHKLASIKGMFTS